MSRWLHGIRMGAMALFFAGMLTNCGGGGGGGGSGGLRLFFGMNGDGNCTSVVVTVDLAGAAAVLARDDQDQPECVLDSDLASDGCDVTFAELNNGDTLRVTINGCTIPESTNLFFCEFTDVDLSELVTETNVQCTCATPGCDGTPPICVDEDSDPRTCEDCDNGLDDDGNGQTDCNDPNCENLPPCSGPTTTSSTTSTTTSSTTSTSTTLPPEPIDVNFMLTSADAPLEALQFTVNYTSAPGQFDGSGTAVSCTNQVDGSTFSANDKDSTRKLTLGLTRTPGFSAPTPLATCQFLAGTPEPVPGNFTVVINEALDDDGHRVKVKVNVTVTGAP